MQAGSVLPGPVRILSDLHLGHDVCTIRRVASLRPLLEGARTVVFNGDTFEARAECFRQRAAEALEELRALCAACGAQPVFLNGNHDPDCWPLDSLELAGGAVFVTHGHVFQRLISPWSAKLRACRADLEKILAEYPPEAWQDLSTRFEIARRLSLAMPPSDTRQKNRTLAGLADLVLREIWPPTRALAVLRVWQALPRTVTEFARTFCPKAQAVIFGHTHRAACWRRDGRLLVNTGAFVTFARPVLVELNGPQLHVHNISCKAGEYRPGPAILPLRLSVPASETPRAGPPEAHGPD